MEDYGFLQGWAEFNRRKWNSRTVMAKFQAPNSEAYGESLLYFNKSGKLYLPPLNPYHPTEFFHTQTDKSYRINKQWHSVAEEMSQTLIKFAGSANFILPPHIRDIRPFLWRGFKVDVKYTYYLELPFSIEKVSASVRTKINKAAAYGYRSERTQKLADVYACLIGTESRQGFSHQLTLADLELARSLLGESAFRCYICYSKEGEPISSSITLVQDNNRALGWVAGSQSAHLTNGVSQQLMYFQLQDLSSADVCCVDFCGANLRSVSEAKSQWNGDLIPYYGIRAPGYKEVLRAGKQWLQFNRKTVTH